MDMLTSIMTLPKHRARTLETVKHHLKPNVNDQLDLGIGQRLLSVSHDVTSARFLGWRGVIRASTQVRSRSHSLVSAVGVILASALGHC
jgi:hypothetical protein